MQKKIEVWYWILLGSCYGFIFVVLVIYTLFKLNVTDTSSVSSNARSNLNPGFLFLVSLDYLALSACAFGIEYISRLADPNIIICLVFVFATISLNVTSLMSFKSKIVHFT